MEEKRIPIILDNHTIAVIHLYTRYEGFEDLINGDIWEEDINDKFINNINIIKGAANEIINQFKDHWTPLLLIEMRKRITKELKDHDRKYGTKFA